MRVCLLPYHHQEVFEFKNNYVYFFASITLSKLLHMMLVKNLQGDLDQQAGMGQYKLMLHTEPCAAFDIYT